MLTCIVLAGQIVLASSAPDGETIILPANAGVEIAASPHSEGTRFRFYHSVQQVESRMVVSNDTPYEEVVAALSDCETD